jgi:isocitrate/isopropylmalate dehydrogenase
MGSSGPLLRIRMQMRCLRNIAYVSNIPGHPWHVPHSIDIVVVHEAPCAVDNHAR